MLIASQADTTFVLNRMLVLVASACCLLVAISFVLFARDQMSGASKHQQNELIVGSGAGTPTTQQPAQHKEGQPRRFIDDAANTLTSPFRSVVQSDSQWVTHGLPTLFALLAYGLGLGYLARFTRGLS